MYLNSTVDSVNSIKLEKLYKCFISATFISHEISMDEIVVNYFRYFILSKYIHYIATFLCRQTVVERLLKTFSLNLYLKQFSPHSSSVYSWRIKNSQGMLSFGPKKNSHRQMTHKRDYVLLFNIKEKKIACTVYQIKLNQSKTIVGSVCNINYSFFKWLLQICYYDFSCGPHICGCYATLTVLFDCPFCSDLFAQKQIHQFSYSDSDTDTQTMSYSKDIFIWSWRFGETSKVLSPFNQKTWQMLKTCGYHVLVFNEIMFLAISYI